MSLYFEFTADEVIEEGTCDKQDIEEIKIWMKNVALPAATDEQIVLFLIACFGNVENTKKTIKAYYYYMYYGKNITNNRDIHSTEMVQQASIIDSVLMPRRTKDNYMVILQKLKDLSHWNFNLEHSIKFYFMTFYLGLIGKPPPSGLITILDFEGVNIMHMTRLRIGPLKLLLNKIQEALPCTLIATHIVNSVYFIDKLVAILKPLMSKELYEKLHFHEPNMDMKKFFENHVEADCMPSDYGGNLPSIRTMSETTLENMKKHADWYIIEENMRKNYKPSSKR